MNKLKVFYTDKQSVAKNSSFSPSAGKPAALLAHWKRSKLPLEVVPFEPCKPAEIALAHNPSYVYNVLNCLEANGFGNMSREIASSLPYTTGSMVAAALHAYQNKTDTVSLTSGFHHARYNSGGGFCTFNGLIIAAQMLRLAGARKIGIVDCDAHFGDGTEDIIGRLGLDYITHYTFGGDRSSRDADWVQQFNELLCDFGECDVILYQAGADPWINDSLGGILTKKQLLERDRAMFDFCKENGIPIAWNLAGGYANPFQHVLDIHTNAAIAKLTSDGDSSHERKINTSDEQAGPGGTQIRQANGSKGNE